MTAVIVANGEFPRKEYPLWLLKSADIVVCCDGAYRHLKRMGIKPVAIVGDMDSLKNEQVDVSVVKVDEQDFNDLNKAFLWLREKYPQATDIHILGATGKSEAHALGNLSYLMYWEQKGLSIDMVSDYNTAFAISDSCELHVGEGRKVSIFSPDNTLSIKSKGLVWPTDDVVFDNLWKATLNRASLDAVKLTFRHPSMALIILE